MGGVLGGLQTILQTVATAMVGPFGIIIVTVGLAGTALAVLLFHAPMQWLWRAGIVSAVLLGAGAIAQGLSGTG
jgi:hypothetical protein